MPAWLSWLIALLRGYLAIKADIAAKEQERVGKVEQTNADLKAALAEVRDEDDAARNTPHGKEETLEALRHGEL